MPRRILLDTNIFIVGLLDDTSTEARILEFLARQGETTILFSLDLEEQLRRVGRRLANKDWAGFVIQLIWRDYTIDYIALPPTTNIELEELAAIPREDWGIYLTAVLGEANCFVSSNRELVKQTAAKQKLFECLTPEEFSAKFFSTNPK